ncbi:hypothetical protein ACFPIJ_14495 [Dactylosporangium cerinum]|uniref:Uncharacterized protein n=1 Tax=Dactylosporangium cerinum TaxID=1434730 RepID=A0ABV9VUW1_9ACTN
MRRSPDVEGVAGADRLDRLAAGAGVVLPWVLAALGPGQFIPSQDATPEMMAQEARDGHVTLVLLAIGCTAGPLVVATGIWLIWRARRAARPQAPSHPDEGPAAGAPVAGQYEP